MEVPYIFAICNTFIAVVYVYSIKIFNFADTGVDYLQTLLNDNPETLNNDPIVLNVLKNRDIYNMQLFTNQRKRVEAIMVGAVVINIVNYVFYPYDTLLYWWMSYILIGAAVIANFDILRTLLVMHRNKHFVSTICNAYYDLVLQYKENKKLDETDALIDSAFAEYMRDLNRIKFIESNNKNGNNEK